MLRILFLGLWSICFLQLSAWGSIEIFANGQKYDSIEAYKASKKSVAVVQNPAKQDSLTDLSQHKLYVLGVEKGFTTALKDFYMTWGQSDIQLSRTISSDQLEEAINQAVTSSKEPKLVISQAGKVRIMRMTTQ